MMRTDDKISSTVKILSFNSNSIVGKLNEIKINVDLYKPDIIAITETKID